jgi:hypothetical protein
MPDDLYRTLDLGPRFIASLLRRDFSATERQRFARALDLLDENERHPSLRVHKLEGVEPELWSASASDVLGSRSDARPADASCSSSAAGITPDATLRIDTRDAARALRSSRRDMFTR